MENSKQITLTRVIKASPAELWRAWTVPEIISKWWGPSGVTNPTCEVDLRIGGTLYIVMLAGKELGTLAGQRWPMKGTFTDIHQNERLVFINTAVDDAGKILLEGETTVSFEDMKGDTRLTVTTSATGKVPEAPQMIAGMEMGWNQSLDKLGALFQ